MIGMAILLFDSVWSSEMVISIVYSLNYCLKSKELCISGAHIDDYSVHYSLTILYYSEHRALTIGFRQKLNDIDFHSSRNKIYS